MEKNSNLIITGLLVLIVGFGAGYFARGSQMPMSGNHMMSSGTMMGNHAMSMGSAMSDMMADLQGKEGDAFDRAFLTGMIVHHQGAVAMAEAALRDAKHTEIKQMARDIIKAQTAEIEQMKTWLAEWYDVQSN